MWSLAGHFFMLTRAKKEEQVENLAHIMQESSTVVFSDFTGLTMQEVGELRNALREAGIKYKATKKSLWPFVFEKSQITSQELLFPEHKGSVGIAFADGDGVEASKIMTAFAKGHEKFAILGAFIHGVFAPSSEVRALAMLPTREELLAKLVYVLAAPVRNIVSVLSAPQRDLITVLSKIKDGK